MDGSGADKTGQQLVERLPPLAQGKAFQIAHRASLKLSGPFRVVRARPAMGVVQEIPQRPESALPARGRDVQRAPRGQLHARGHKMQLHTPAFGVLMPHPGDVILLGVEAGKGQGLELIHHLPLLILGRRILQGEADHAMGIAPLAVDAVDQIPRPVDVAAHHLGRGMIAALAVGVGQILRDGYTAALPAAGELNQHRGASHAWRVARPAPGRSRSAAPGAQRFPPGNDGSRPWQAD